LASASAEMTDRHGARVPKELLRPWLLLLLGQCSSYGYALAERLRTFGIDVGTSVVYAALRRLESAGLATSSLDLPSRGPARRLYRLTAEGLQARADWAASLDDLQARV
jgi:PadR family transcriptional regulator PadR